MNDEQIKQESQTILKESCSRGPKRKDTFPCIKCGKPITNSKETCAQCASRKCDFPGCGKTFSPQRWNTRPLCHRHFRIKFNQTLIRNGKWIGPNTIDEYMKIRPGNNGL